MVKTKDHSVFWNEGKKQVKMEKKIDRLIPNDPELGQQAKRELAMHKVIRVSSFHSCQLFVAQLLDMCFCACIFDACCCLKSNVSAKYKSLYRIGEHKIEKELNIVHMIKSIRDLNFFMKKQLKSKKSLFEIKHTPNNLIDLDNNIQYSSSSSSSSSSSEEGNRGILTRNDPDYSFDGQIVENQG